MVGKKGRPAHNATAALKRQVAIAASAGMPKSQICLALGIDIKTLDRHYQVELTTGASALKMKRLRAMHAAALKGNVAAAKYCDVVGGGAPQGKKQKADADAMTAQQGTEWDCLLDRSTVQ